MDFKDQLVSVVQEALERLDGVLALRETPTGATPHLYKKEDDAFDSLASAPRYPMAMVLDRVLDQFPEVKLGVVVRGCDEWALIEIAKRHQIDLDRIEMLGMACSHEQAIECRCSEPYPSHIMIGEQSEGVQDEWVAEHRQLSLEERRSFWEGKFAQCIKCYGCRNICPVCYCPACALEDEIWVERGVMAPSFPSFHLVRAMHMVGRCIGCKQCELVCPAHIPLPILYTLMRQDAAALWGYVPGKNVDDQPPLLIPLST